MFKGKNILLLAFLLGTLGTSAQLRYEDLDRLSRQISEIQYRAQPIVDYSGTFTFPEQNFVALFSTKKANLASYVKTNDKEEFQFINGVDLSQVKSIYYYTTPGGVQTVAAYVNVPFNTQVITAGEQKTKLAEIITFKFKKGNTVDQKALIDAVGELVILFKKESNPKNRDGLEKELKEWKLAVNSNTNQAYSGFCDRYPNSIFFKESQARAKATDPVATLKLSEFYVGMDKREFENIIRGRTQQIEVTKKTPLLQDVKDNYRFDYGEYNSFTAYNSLDELTNKVYALRIKKREDYGLSALKARLMAAKISSSLGLSGYARAELDRISFDNFDMAKTVKVNVIYPSDFTDWDDIRQAFIKKFGEPSEKYTEKSSNTSYIDFRWPEKGYGLIFKTKFKQVLAVKLYKEKYEDPSVRSPVMLEIEVIQY